MRSLLIAAVTGVFLAGQPKVVLGQGYQGVSETHPTGSAGIDPTALVLAFDMSSRITNDRLRDYGPLGNHGEISGTTDVPGIHNRAMGFHVATDRVHLVENESLAIDGPLTIALWLRMETLGLHQHILACDDKFALWVTPQNKIRFSDTLGHGVDLSEPVTVGPWYSIVAVFDGPYGGEVTRASTRLYVNGERAETNIVNRSGDDPVRWVPGELYPSDACYIGFESHQGNEAHQTLQFEGVIDELLVFGRALSDREIQIFAGRQ